MNSIAAKCGHVTRRLRQNKPLTGKVLEFALSVIGDGQKSDGTVDPFNKGIADKLKAGQPLSEYEYHILVEVVLLHVRLSDGATPIRKI